MKMYDVSIGMVLGDGYIRLKKGNKNFNLVIKHSPKQYEYLLWKMELIKKILGVNYSLIRGQSETKGKIYSFCVGETTVHTFLSKIHGMMYVNNVKTISLDSLNYLSPLGLSIWYMDDGGLSFSRVNGRIRSRRIVLNTQSFSLSENQTIKDYFLSRWNIETRLEKDKTYCRIVFGANSANKFLDIIGNHVSSVDCMHYKLDLKYSKNIS